jgi:hypothetical protein
MKHFPILLLALSCNNILFSQQKTEVSDGNTKLFVGGGITQNSVVITGSSSGVEINIDHPKTLAPTFVIGSKFTVKKTNNLLITIPSIRIYSINSTAKKDLTSGMATYHHTSTFKATPVISPTASLGYNIIRRQSFKWYVSGGIGFAFLIKGEEVQSNHYDPSDTDLTVPRKPNSMIFAFNAQIGFDIGKNLGIWAFYQPPTNTSTKVEKKVQISTLQAGLCYYFKVK